MPSRPIVLDLTSPPVASPDGRAVALTGVIEDLVALLESQFPTGADFPSDALRTRLQQSRERLRSAEHPEDVQPAGLRLVGDASQAYARLSGHVAAREAEFYGVIRLLRELVDGLRGDAQAFRHDLLRSSERVADLTQIEDIRTLRRALSREVDQLRQCVQHGEHRESSRLAQVAGDLEKVDAAMAAKADDERKRTSGLLTRAVLLGDLEAAPATSASIVVCRIDEPDAIVEGHGAPVLDRVVVALSHLLKGTFGKDLKVYRTSTQCVAMFLPLMIAKRTAQLIKQVQARVAPEYEYERHGVKRSVVFTFSAVVVQCAGKGPSDASDALLRAESQAAALEGLSQLGVEATGLGRIVGWLSS
jgi:GGDEF domain-containing protein